MKVVTTQMRPGYMRRNGVPYSGSAVLTEFFDRSDEANGDVWLIVTLDVGRPDVPRAAAHDVDAFQAGARRIEVESASEVTPLEGQK